MIMGPVKMKNNNSQEALKTMSKKNKITKYEEEFIKRNQEMAAMRQIKN